MNPFFQLPDAPSFSPADGFEGAVYYARFGQAEYEVPTDEGPAKNFVRMEAISQPWFDQVPIERFLGANDYGAAFVRYFSEAPIAQIELQFTRADTGRFGSLKELLSADDNGAEPEKWFRIRIGGRRDQQPADDVVALTLHPNLYTGGAALTLAGIDAVDQETQARLEAAVSTGHIQSATDQDLENLLSPIARARIDWVVVYDVGQGNAIGLCADGMGPLVYFDFGGGSLANVATFPPSLKNFCFSWDPPIILSHWDEDHWSSANRAPRALALDWIAPRQKIGPTQAAMIANIQSAGGRVWFLPSGYSAKRYGQLHLELATGSGRNNSGIVLTLAENQYGTGQQILMPGDAGYKFIPSFTGRSPYLSVVASHHGGALKGSTPPSCPGAGHSRLVYSAGPGNSYRHPLLPTRQAHDAAGWIDLATGSAPPELIRETATRSTTGLGHVYLGWALPGTLPGVPCGTRCQLAPQQS